MLKNVLFGLVGALALLIAYGVLKSLLPGSITIESVQAAYAKEDFVITDLRKSPQPQRESAESWEFKVGDYRVEILHYDDEGKVAKHAEYLRDDPGSAMVENMNIAQNIGEVAKPKTFSDVRRRGKWVCYVTGPEKGVCQSLTQVFRGA